MAKVPHRLRKRVAREVATIFKAPGLTEAKKHLAEIKARWMRELPEAITGTRARVRGRDTLLRVS